MQFLVEFVRTGASEEEGAELKALLSSFMELTRHLDPLEHFRRLRLRDIQGLLILIFLLDEGRPLLFDGPLKQHAIGLAYGVVQRLILRQHNVGNGALVRPLQDIVPILQAAHVRKVEQFSSSKREQVKLHISPDETARVGQFG